MGKLIIQITDMHLFENVSDTLLGVNTFESFRAVVKDIKQTYPNPDLILLTGDLAQDETVTAYQKLVDELTVFHCPKYGFPGNHDDEQHMLSIFRENHLQENREIIVGNWNLILLNTQKRHAVEGLLSDEQLEFLDNSLGMYPEHSTMIFMHHPPMPVGSAWIDRLILSNPEPFWETLARYHHVNAIVCGHVHQTFSGVRNGIQVLTTPSTCFQFAARSQKFAVENLMPGYRAIEIDEQGGFETKVHRITGFELNLDMSSGGY
ncbi:MAG: 3',5'-cyclic-AMP phosphodiesterase [Gammaproteobacteria bacterium]